MVLEEDKTIRLGNSEHWPKTSRIVETEILHGYSNPNDAGPGAFQLEITLSDPTLPEPMGSGIISPFDYVESHVTVEEFSTTEDQQLRLDRYENELNNLLFLSATAQSLPLDLFTEKLQILATRCISVLRHEDPDLVLQIEGKNEAEIEASNDKLK